MADHLMADENSSAADDKTEQTELPRLTGIEFPAKIQNVDRMLKTLGGEEAISKTLGAGSAHKLEMKFRPEDPFCRSLYATMQPATSLLLRVKKRYKKTPDLQAASGRDDGNEEEEEVVEEPVEKAEYRTELVGVIDSMYKFRGMCDFQYLPVHRSKETGCAESLIETIVPSRPEGASLLKQKVPLLLLPPVFSRTDACSDYVFQPDVVPSTESLSYKVANQLDKNIVGSSRARRPHNTYLVSFEQDAIPTAAHPAALLAVKKGKERDSAIGALSDELVQLFEKRPMWSRGALKHNCSLTKRQLTVLLPSVSYYFTTGPWRSTWVRLGYDPLADPDSLQYQMLDFRLRKSLYLNKTGRSRDRRHRSRRASDDRSLLSAMQRPLTKRMSTYMGAPWAKALEQDVRKPKDKDAYFIFREGLVPASTQMFYQLCDLHHEDIQAFIRAKSLEVGQGQPVHYFKQEVLDELRLFLHRVLRKTLEDRQQKAAAGEVDDSDIPGPSASQAGDAEMNEADLEDDEDMDQEDEDDEEEDSPNDGEDEIGEEAEGDNLVDDDSDEDNDDSENEMDTELLEFLSGT